MPLTTQFREEREEMEVVLRSGHLRPIAGPGTVSAVHLPEVFRGSRGRDQGVQRRRRGTRPPGRFRPEEGLDRSRGGSPPAQALAGLLPERRRGPPGSDQHSARQLRTGVHRQRASGSRRGDASKKNRVEADSSATTPAAGPPKTTTVETGRRWHPLGGRGCWRLPGWRLPAGGNRGPSNRTCRCRDSTRSRYPGRGGAHPGRIEHGALRRRAGQRLGRRPLLLGR